MKLTEEINGEVPVLRLNEARLDASKAPGLRTELLRQITAGHSRIVVDLSAAKFMDGSGLSALVTGGSFVIVGAQGPLARLFALTRMDRVFALHPTTDAAVAELAG